MGLFGGSSERKRLGNGDRPTGSSDARRTNFVVGAQKVTAECKLAEGGFAIVYRVVDSRGRRLALKRQFIRDDYRHMEACQREADILRGFSGHSNIVQYAASSIQQQPDGVYEYMLLTLFYPHSVLELMNERLVRGEYLNGGEVVRIMCDMCRAVGALHHARVPIIHRDLKVENILADGANPPRFVLCDFGSATTIVLNAAVQGYPAVHEEIEKYTTLSYRSPEMVDLYSNVPIGPKSDIWALGVMLYKLCYFSLPFGESALAIQSGQFSFPDSPAVSTELRSMCCYLLTKDVEQRPDVFQAATGFFSLTGTKCPVQNVNNCPPPNWRDLLCRLDEMVKSSAPGVGRTPSSNAVQQVPLIQKTTVAPRLRPKATMQIASGLPTTSDVLEAAGRQEQDEVQSPRVDPVQKVLGFTDLPDAPVTSASTDCSPAVDVERPVATDGAMQQQQQQIQRGHRRNQSDTTGVALNAATHSAYWNQADGASSTSQYNFENIVNDHSTKAPVIVTDECNTSVELDSWNPFADAPFGADASAAPGRTVDDANFGAQFDMLPRPKRVGSVSSTSNVKSSESLIMDERDPFGQAPFNPLPQTGVAHRQQRATGARSQRSSQATLKESPPPPVPSHSAALGGDGERSPPVPHAAAAKSYRKLVEHGADESNLTADEPDGGRLRPMPHGDEADSVGSATDLHQRMGSSDVDNERPASDGSECSGRAGTSSGSQPAGWADTPDDGGADRLIAPVDERADLPPPVPPHQHIPPPTFPPPTAHRQEEHAMHAAQTAMSKARATVTPMQPVEAGAAAHTLPRQSVSNIQHNALTSCISPPVAVRCAPSDARIEQPIRLVVNNSPRPPITPASAKESAPPRAAEGSSSDEDVRSFCSHSKSTGGGGGGGSHGWTKRSKESKRSQKSLKHYYDELERADEHMLVDAKPLQPAGSGTLATVGVTAGVDARKPKTKRPPALLGSASFVNSSFMDEDDAACRF